MPELGPLHPIIVHFVIGLLYVGVALRLLSFTKKINFAGPAAATLILLGTAAAYFAVESGHEAHEIPERIPGVRAAIDIHEEWGERTRNLFIVVAVLEIAALVVKQDRIRTIPLVLSAAVGVGGLFTLFETGEHGGDLVYEYAAGVGTRSEEPEDVGRLLQAGLYNQAMLDRSTGNAAGAARLMQEMFRRSPDDMNVRLLAIGSLIEDSYQPRAALDALDAMPVPADDGRVRYNVLLLRARAYEAAGIIDSARTVLEGMLQDYPGNRRIQSRLENLGD